MVSEGAVLRAGMRALAPRRAVSVVEELEHPADLLAAVSRHAASVVIAAPTDGGDEELFRALDALPPACGAVVLLSVPGFRIQSTVLERRFDIVCLPLTVGRAGLLGGIREALRVGSSHIAVEEVASGAHGTLSQREQEVLLELVQGKSNRQIAEAMWLSEDTIKSHLRRVYRKLDVNSRAEAVALYVGQLGRPGPQAGASWPAANSA